MIWFAAIALLVVGCNLGKSVPTELVKSLFWAGVVTMLLLSLMSLHQ